MENYRSAMNKRTLSRWGHRWWRWRQKTASSALITLCTGTLAETCWLTQTLTSWPRLWLLIVYVSHNRPLWLIIHSKAITSNLKQVTKNWDQIKTFRKFTTYPACWTFSPCCHEFRGISLAGEAVMWKVSDCVLTNLCKHSLFPSRRCPSLISQLI